MRGGLYIETGFKYKEIFKEPKLKIKAGKFGERSTSLTRGERGIPSVDLMKDCLQPTNNFLVASFKKKK
jgi:hypothetical protein